MIDEKKEKTGKLSFVDKLKSNKKLSYSIACILIVIVLFIVLSGVFSDKKKTQSDDLVSLYVESLENRLTSLLKNVEGVGNVSVAISVESGMETVLASEIITTETINGKETVETPIVINGKTVTVKELYPKITGVLIVAEGANNIATRTKIQQATVSLLDINLNRVEILTMK